MLDNYVYYRDDTVVLYHGDNATILPLLEAESVDVVVTSPPYNTGMVGNAKVKPSGFRKEHSMAKNLDKMTSGYSDTIDEIQYQSEQIRLIKYLARVLKPTGSIFYNHKIRWRDKVMIHPYSWLMHTGDHIKMRMEIVWDRGVGLTLNARRFYDQDERIYWLVKSGQWHWNQKAVGHGSVWRIAPTAFKQHACVFPEALVARCLNGTCQPGMAVLDPYAGSGTVAAVARKFGCRSILIEQDPKYCDVIVERLSQQALPLDQPTEEALL